MLQKDCLVEDDEFFRLRERFPIKIRRNGHGSIVCGFCCCGF